MVIFAGVILFALLMAFIIIAALVGVVIINAAAIAVAVAVALLVAALIGTGTPSLALTAAIAALVFALLQRRRRPAIAARSATIDVPARVVEPLPQKPIPTSRDPALDDAFEALAENADGSRSRLAVARNSCRMFLLLADRFPMDADGGALAVRIRRRIPEYVAESLTTAESATPSERRAILDASVATLEQVGAEAERHRARLQALAGDTLDLQRRHLTRGSEASPLSLD